MKRFAPSQRRRTLTVVDRIGTRSATDVLIILAISFGLAIAGVSVYQSMIVSGEFVVVYRETVTVEEATVDGREIERRGSTIEAVAETTRLGLLLPVLAAQNLALLIGIAAAALYRGHRISGPVYRMSTDIRRAMSGERSVRIALREHDQLQDLALRINSLLAALDAASQGDDSAR